MTYEEQRSIALMNKLHQELEADKEEVNRLAKEIIERHKECIENLAKR